MEVILLNLNHPCFSFFLTGGVQELDASVYLSAAEAPCLRSLLCIPGPAGQWPQTRWPLWGQAPPWLHWDQGKVNGFEGRRKKKKKLISSGLEFHLCKGQGHFLFAKDTSIGSLWEYLEGNQGLLVSIRKNCWLIMFILLAIIQGGISDWNIAINHWLFWLKWFFIRTLFFLFTCH